MGVRRLGRLITALLLTGVVAGGVGANAASATEAPVFGFNDNAVGQGTVSNSDDAAWLSNAGADVARAGFEWRWVERNKGVYDFSGYDSQYSALRARGIRPIITVMFAPSWAIAPSIRCDFARENCRYPPAKSHDSDWANMLSAVARRYPQAAGIELWNEPNLVAFWQAKPDVARYTDLLKIGYQAVKAANPSMPVLLGGLANFQTSDDAGNVALRAFLAGIYANGGKGFMDGISFHPYPYSLGDALLYKSFDDVRDMRDLYSDHGTPLWATETGLTTTGSNAFTEADQARSLVHLYRTLGAMPDVAAVLAHSLFEPPEELEGSTGHGFGTVHENGVPKPAFCALAAARETSYDCPPSVFMPGANATQDANWAAQRLVHSALDASRDYYSAHATYAGLTNAVLHDMVPALSSLAPDPGGQPGPAADPTRIGIYYSSGSPDDITVCNASTGSYAYCIWQRRGSWIRYNRSTASIAGAYKATRTTGGLDW